MFIVEFVSKAPVDGGTSLLNRVENQSANLCDVIKFAGDISRNSPACAVAHFVVIRKANGVQEWLGLSEGRHTVRAVAKSTPLPSYRPERSAPAEIASEANR